MFIDRIHRLPRVWSNNELRKFSHLFSGKIVNVSAWKDSDKEGNHYKNYFKNAASYTLTNYKSEARGFQGYEDEIFLDLEKILPDFLFHQFDVVFNHTTLEHVYSVKIAFENLCKMSRDIVITVVPFLQPYHSEYGDYWRFSPLAINRLFIENNFKILYQSFNKNKMSSIYIFTIASKNPEKWKNNFGDEYNSLKQQYSEQLIGCHAFPNIAYRLRILFRNMLKLIKTYRSGIL